RPPTPDRSPGPCREPSFDTPRPVNGPSSLDPGGIEPHVPHGQRLQRPLTIGRNTTCIARWAALLHSAFPTATPWSGVGSTPTSPCRTKSGRAELGHLVADLVDAPGDLLDLACAVDDGGLVLGDHDLASLAQ